MRAGWLISLSLAACSPDIAPGTYLCGDERACPDGQACDGPTNTCVLASAAEPFACGGVTEVEPNEAFGTAQLVEGLQCVSRVAEVLGCTRADGSAEDWYGFSVPANCGEVHATARMAFPIAFEPLSLELRDANGTTRGSGERCPQDAADDGTAWLCVDVVVPGNATYAIRVAGAGTADCDGACAFNRYTLTMQLAGP